MAFGLCGLVVVGLGLFSGCSKKADENKPISEVKAEADQMDVSALRAQAMAYKDAILAKQKDLEKIQEQIKRVHLKKVGGIFTRPAASIATRPPIRD